MRRAAGRRGASRSRSGRSGGAAKASSEIVAGRNAVVEALRADIPVTTMYVAGRIDADDRVREALKTATERSIPVLETPARRARPAHRRRRPPGPRAAGAALRLRRHPATSSTPQAPGIPLVVALDGVTDPRNLGAVVRSVAAFGGHGVSLPERRSAGMTRQRVEDVGRRRRPGPRGPGPATSPARSRTFQKAGFFVLGLDMEGDVELPGLALATEPVVVVVGSEGKGLSRLVRETCDQVVSIPMSSAVESLNAGVAAGVTLYEIARQRAAAR